MRYGIYLSLGREREIQINSTWLSDAEAMYAIHKMAGYKIIRIEIRDE